jgi:glycine reductase
MRARNNHNRKKTLQRETFKQYLIPNNQYRLIEHASIRDERSTRMNLKGKKVIIIGERDGIQGPAIEACVKSAGGEPVMTQTQCFV